MFKILIDAFIGRPDDLNSLLLFLILPSHQLNLVVQVFYLVFQNLHVVLSRPVVVLELGLDALLLRLLHPQLLDLLPQLLNRVFQVGVLFFYEFCGFSMV